MSCLEWSNPFLFNLWHTMSYSVSVLKVATNISEFCAYDTIMHAILVTHNDTQFNLQFFSLPQYSYVKENIKAQWI